MWRSKKTGPFAKEEVSSNLLGKYRLHTKGEACNQRTMTTQNSKNQVDK